MIKTKFEQPKTSNIVIRVLETDKDFFKAYAAKEGYNMSEFVRIAIDNLIADMEAEKRTQGGVRIWVRLLEELIHRLLRMT